MSKAHVRADPRVTQGAIFEMSCRCSGTQPVRYAQYYESPFKFMLEYAVAVSETAFSIGEPARCAVYSIKAFHRMDQIGGLDTVCPDILNCRSTHFTRNTGEVLDSPRDRSPDTTQQNRSTSHQLRLLHTPCPYPCHNGLSPLSGNAGRGRRNHYRRADCFRLRCEGPRCR